VNYATNVLAADLLDGIVNKMPRYGIRPPVLGYLYATEVGKWTYSVLKMKFFKGGLFFSDLLANVKKKLPVCPQ
jgi:hypothetical protein